MRRLFLAAPLLLGLGACTAVGPDYVAPQTAATPKWLEPADPGAIDPAWWRQFGDPQLTGLIERALAEAPTLAEARARLAEARADRDATLGRRLPQVNASGSATTNRISENGQIPAGQTPGFPTGYDLFDIGFDSSWEIDFWGRREREGQAAQARVAAAEARVEDALVMLTGEIARTYIDLRSAQLQIVEAERNAVAASEIARLARLRYQAGEGNKLEADRADADAAGARESVAGIRAQASAAAYRLGSLVGAPPEDVVPALQESAPLPQTPETILAGLRSDLLRRRPDIRAAERDLAAASADIGVATADLFPRFSLVGGLGTQSRSVGGLADSGSLRFSIGPSFSWPIFAGGRIRAQIRAADARADVAAARYEKAIAEALADSESAINRYLAAQRSQTEVAYALAAQQSAFALAKTRLEAGEDDRLMLERAAREILSRERSLTNARTATAQAAVAVYKALGGAWLAQEASRP